MDKKEYCDYEIMALKNIADIIKELESKIPDKLEHAQAVMRIFKYLKGKFGDSLIIERELLKKEIQLIENLKKEVEKQIEEAKSKIQPE